MNEFTFKEVESDAVRALKGQIQFEVEVARSNDNLFSYTIGLLALHQVNLNIDVDHDYIRSKFKVAREELSLGNLELLDVEFITGVILAFRLLSELRKSKEEDKQTVEKVFKEIVSKDWLGSVDLASYTLFALKENEFTSITENAKLYLLDVLEKSIRQRRTLSPKIISALFGLSFTDAKLDNFFNDLDFSQIDDLNLKDLAKLGICLYNKHGSIGETINEIIQRVENEVYKEFYECESIKLREGIRDAISLIASGLSEEELNHLLKLSNLSDLLEVKSNSIILKPMVLNKISPTEFPPIDPEGHALALILLTSTGLDKRYVIDKESLNLAIKGLNSLKEGFVPIKRSQIIWVRNIVPLLIITLTILAEVIVGTSWEDVITVLDLIFRRNLLTFEQIISKPSLSAIILVFGIGFAIFTFRILDRLIERGSIDKLTVITSAPIVSWLYKHIKGEDSK